MAENNISPRKQSLPSNKTVDSCDIYDMQQYKDAYFEALTDHLIDMLIVFDSDLNLQYKSASFIELLGPSRIADNDPFNFIHPDDLPIVTESINYLIQNPDEPLHMEIRGQNRDGAWRHYEVNARNLLADPTIEGIVANFRDITEQKTTHDEVTRAHTELEHSASGRTKDLQDAIDALLVEVIERNRIEDVLRESEQELRKKEAHFRAVIENTLDATMILNTSGTLLYASPSYTRILGREFDAEAQTSLFEHIHTDDRDHMSDVFAQLLAHNWSNVITELRAQHRDGSWVYLEFIGHNLLEHPALNAIVASFRDITERKQAEEALRNSEEKYQNLYNNAEVGLFQTRMSDGKFVSCNQHCAEMAGYDNIEQFLKEYVTTDHFTDPAARARMKDEIRRNGGVRNFEVEITDRYNVIHWWSLSARAYPERGILEGACSSITERKQAERALERRTQQILALQKVNTSIQSTLGVKEVLQRIAESVVLHMGYHTSLILLANESNSTLRWSMHYPYDEESSLKAAEHNNNVSAKLIYASDIENVVGIPINQIEIPVVLGYSKVMDDYLDRKETVVHSLHEIAEPFLSKKECGSVQELLNARTIVGVPFYAKDKLVGSMIAFTARVEITEADLEPLRLLADQAAIAIENAMLNEDLEQKVLTRTNQLQAVNKELESFAYSVSHDLRAPLRGIDGFSQMLYEDYYDSLDDQGQDYLQRIRSNSQRMAQLIESLLNLSRLTRSELNYKAVDLSVIAVSFANDLKQREPERNVEFIITPGLIVECDEALLQATMENLIGNAWKFTSSRETARIEIGYTDYNGHSAYFVRDDGAGFDMANSGKLFGAFQRLHTQNEFEGTGIGLATVQRIINRHGGKVWAEGEVDKGATFYFTIAG